MDENNEILKQLISLRKEIATKNGDLKSSISIQISNLTDHFKSFEHNVSTEIENLKKTNVELNNRVSNMERQLRSKNVIIHGLPENDGAKLHTAIIMFLSATLGVLIREENIEYVGRLGPKINNKIRPVLLKLSSQNLKSIIFSNCSKLKGTNMYISEDLPKEERQIKNILLKHYRNAKQLGLNTKIINNKLIINEKIWTVQDLKLLDIANASLSPFVTEISDSVPITSQSQNYTKNILPANESLPVQQHSSPHTEKDMLPPNPYLVKPASTNIPHHNIVCSEKSSTGAAPKQKTSNRNTPVTRSASQQPKQSFR